MTKQLKESPSQTAGPYVHIGCVPNSCGITGVYGQDLGVSARTGGDTTITGTVFDGAGDPLTDAMIEIWHADETGAYTKNSTSGWARSASDQETGLWQFFIKRPGSVPFDTMRMMASHITFWIVARGINVGLHTRMYFPGDPMLDQDPWLLGIAPQRRETLIAQQTGDDAFRFDIHLQGPDETVFFDV